jgi:hypothetical protein
MPVHDRGRFENLYAGQPRRKIGRPQKALLDATDRITGSVLETAGRRHGSWRREGWGDPSFKKSAPRASLLAGREVVGR